jgi:hypothetical protein
MLLLTIFFPSAAMPLSSAYISTARLKEGPYLCLLILGVRTLNSLYFEPVARGGAC